MSLNAALNIAQNSLGHISRQTAVVARNVNDAGTSGYVRRDAVNANMVNGSRVYVARAQLDAQLVRAEREALSAGSAHSVLASGLQRLGAVMGSPEGEASLHTAIGRLSDNVQVWSSDPSNPSFAATTADAARGVVRTVGEAARQIAVMETETTQAVKSDVAALNDLLQQFGKSNGAVVDGIRSGRPDYDAADARDEHVRAIARLIDVTSVARGGGDMMLLTRDGTSLFETVPREVGFVPASGSAPAQVSVDGVPLRHSANSANGIPRGAISARLQMLNQVLPEADARLTGVAQGLVDAFGETAAGQSDAPGLFQMTDGTARSFTLSPAYDDAAGGSIERLRDGGANGAAYLANTSGADGFAGRLIAVSDGSAAVRTLAFDQAGWIDGMTADATHEAAAREAVAVRITGQLSQQGGVDIDGELTRLLELERGYEASARMLSTANSMLETLLQAVR